MREGYAIRGGDGRYYMTFQVVGWVDIFSRQRYRDIVLDSFAYCRAHKGLELNAYVIMSNHIHVIMAAQNDNLSDVIRDMKAHQARQILASIQQEPESRKEWMLSIFKFAASGHQKNERIQFWKHDNHPIFMDPLQPDRIQQRLNYIHLNPVRAGLVAKPEDYLYSSASNYAGEGGLIEIDSL